MKFTTALVALVAAHSTSAFKVPEGAVDGNYIAYINPEGVEVHQAVDSFHSVPHVSAQSVAARSYPPPSERSLEARVPNGQTFCGCGIHLQGGTCDDAVGDLEHQLGNGASVQGGLSYYAIRGDVVAFVCNPGPYDARVSGGDASQSLGRVTGACGYYIAGTYDYGIKIGYMHTGQNWCDNADRSKAHRC